MTITKRREAAKSRRKPRTLGEFNAIYYGKKLTDRRLKVLEMLLNGQTDAEIAKKLFIQTNTVRKHVANICEAFHIKNASNKGCSHRLELRNLFIKFKPELVKHNKRSQIFLNQQKKCA